MPSAGASRVHGALGRVQDPPASPPPSSEPLGGEAKLKMTESTGVVSIQVNGDEREVGAGTSVAELVAGLSLQPGAVVVERNREILARDALSSTSLEDGDRIELVHFVGGG